ncbi:PREDICTED: non-specific lipid transfer protein GPI-anchored 1-like [Nelumbo nucifera]|uniref:Non-specific lipid transfer protein GPI-anchored 1-like n=2 Tax=Nelumbo nucifera TaxID=4432 RepID=A0A1U7ZKW5_NELNU|nr:PREDICTED: non-specific lipid transfer protein GPI-anchored 1-like [Nelumbo nucifera]DAD30547.1 TPA_asm: hypothetical protein HUJ06_009398 [Nelumbo nucifera]
MKMRFESILFCLLVAPYFFASIFSDAASVEQCSSSLTSVTNCLDYSSGKAESPNKDCCNSVTKIRDQNPVCLCFIIQQTHKGTNSFKQLGLKEDRLLQLPTACKLANASVSECPKLLDLPPNSPDAAIFNTTTNSTAPSSTTTSSSPDTSSSTTHDSSNGFIHGPHTAVSTVITAVVVAICTSLLPNNFMSVRQAGA